MLLYKILSAVRKELEIVEGTQKISRYADLAVGTVLPVRQMVNEASGVHINGRPTLVVSRELAMGFSNALRDVYQIENIPRSLELRALNDVKNLPSLKIGDQIRFTETSFVPELDKKIDTNAKKIMSSTDPETKLTVDVVEKNPALKAIFDKMNNKTFRTVGGWVVVIGLGTAAGVLAVNEHRNRLTACLLYYYVKGSLTSCVIPTCTCKPTACTSKCNYCSEALMNLLPDDMKVDNCEGFKGTGCVNCPSEAFNPTNISNDSSLDANKNDQYFVRCFRPTFYEALTDLWGGASEDLINIVKGALQTANWLVNALPIIFIIAVVIIVIVVILSIISKFSSSSQSPKVEQIYYDRQEFDSPPPYDFV